MKTYHDVATDGGSDVLGQVASQEARLARRLSTIGRVVAVTSGKGGVGKSTVTAVLAEALAARGCTVGMLDADINGPSLAWMAGVRSHTPSPTADGMAPAISAQGVKVMSMDLFLPQDATAVLWDAPTQDHAYTWRPMVEMGALRELLSDTDWGTLDVLLIDLPPGSDKLPNVAGLVPSLAGSIVVTGPTAVSQMVVARSITMATEVAHTPVIGVLENMAAYVCSRCARQDAALATTNSAEQLALAHGVPFLGRIPMDPHLAAATDQGSAFLEHHGDSAAAQAIQSIARRVYQYLFD